ncbi:MAG TPA: PIG-L deacetylase family protein [Ktedonobacteraceae bacterium]|nr:PIG-L deacetylase family protein [Ktedonobacteraceae bacterium]
MSNRNPTILAVFAHPDDDALTCLGTLAKFVQAHCQVHVLTLTAGERSNTAVDLIRLSEAETVARLVGYSLIQHRLYDGRLTCDIEMVSLIEKYIRELGPQVVITHYPQKSGYGHQDHDNVATATVNAARRSSCVDCILYAEPPVQNWGFAPNFFIDITDFIDLKKHAIAVHHSESTKSYMLPDIAAMRARWWALQNHPETFCAGRYLEPFVLVKGLFGHSTFNNGSYSAEETGGAVKALDMVLNFPALLPSYATNGAGGEKSA